MAFCGCAPRVASPSFVKSTSEGRQPWAGGRNPFGIGDAVSGAEQAGRTPYASRDSVAALPLCTVSQCFQPAGRPNTLRAQPMRGGARLKPCRDTPRLHQSFQEGFPCAAVAAASARSQSASVRLYALARAPRGQGDSLVTRDEGIFDSFLRTLLQVQPQRSSNQFLLAQRRSASPFAQQGDQVLIQTYGHRNCSHGVDVQQIT